ncbi:MAG TPA: SIMPL domain-containing protein [Candidatus Paceibacterota bacterium]|nr:SIMPL domain-containing protein [Candidatus Paceibacterota bacterium]
MKAAAALVLVMVVCTAFAGERFVSTIGAVTREIPADRLAMTLEVAATEMTIEASVAALDRLLEEFSAQMIKLNYPATAVTVKERKTQKAWEWNDQKRVLLGFSSSATLSVHLLSLTNYGKLLTFIGTHEQYEIQWTRLSGSSEGQARRSAVAEALQAARTKAVLLAEEGEAKLGKLLEVTEEEVELPEFSRARNARDPNEGTAAYPIEILVRVRAKFELSEN